MSRYSLNEVLKAKEAGGQKQNDNGEMKLDDVTRVKILSPGRQVFKRFVRNRLAIVGSVILITMFVFCFIGPIFYAYGQSETFYRYQAQNVNYAQAKVNINFNGYTVDDSVKFDLSQTNMANSAIKTMIKDDMEESLQVSEHGTTYIHKLKDGIYSLEEADAEEICTVGGAYAIIGTYDAVTKTLTYADGTEEISGLQGKAAQSIKKGTSSGSFDHRGTTYFFEKDVGQTYKVTFFNEGVTYASLDVKMDARFEAAVEAAAESGNHFMYRGKTYLMVKVKDGVYTAYQFKGSKLGMVYSIFTFDPYETGKKVSNEFKSAALMAAYKKGAFSVDGVNYTISPEGENWKVCLEDGTEFGEFGIMSIRRFSGSDSMDYQLKKDISNAIAEMNESGAKTADVKALLPQQQEDGKYAYDEDGNLQYVNSDLIITQEDAGNYVINCEQILYVLNTNADPSPDHLFGTDGYGMDVLARIMYGGRVSLMVGFVVIIIETILGVIMGGIAGYFGSWVDTVIMRLVDIFYCLPSLPIMIIIGALMDAARMEPINRLMIMMAALGVMGWASVARLVRGQILSLREQEFMVATEATGMKVRVRIFRHLVPNVMPQLIVTATMGLGGVILTESTLSFLGLGVKHPYATWGTMINSVSTAAAMAHYAYIWIPIGLLICLTVIAFNFVGDGLRDAYDPRAKR